jgi:hypothetical protein
MTDPQDEHVKSFLQKNLYFLDSILRGKCDLYEILTSNHFKLGIEYIPSLAVGNPDLDGRTAFAEGFGPSVKT